MLSFLNLVYIYPYSVFCECALIAKYGIIIHDKKETTMYKPQDVSLSLLRKENMTQKMNFFNIVLDSFF